MMLLTFALVCIVVPALAFQQSDYHIVHENFSVEFVNAIYIKNLKTALFGHGKTRQLINASATVVQDLFGTDITNIVVGSKLTNGEYRPFPTLWNGNACDAIKYNTFGTGVANFETNFKGCPVKKGFYYLTNAFLDDSKLPPHAPKGRYVIDLKVFYNKTVLVAEGKWYVEIQARN